MFVEVFKQKIKNIIQLCDEEIYAIQSGKKSEVTLQEAEEVILPEMKKLLQMIDSSQPLPQQKDRYIISFACAFKDWNWNMQNPSRLYMELSQFNDLYKKI